MSSIGTWFLATTAAVVIGVAALLLGEKSPVKKIPSIDATEIAWHTTTFRDWAYFGDPAEIPTGIVTRGSRIEGGEYRGAFTSGWFAARPRVEMLVAGFPHLPGNVLAVDARDATGRITPIPFDRVNPRESWRPWTIALPSGAVARDRRT